MARDVSDRLPRLVIASRGVRQLQEGFPWVWASFVRAPTPDPPAGVVGLTDERGNWLGQGFYNPTSTIRVRFLAATKRPLDDRWLRRQLTEAVTLRDGPLGLFGVSCRLVHSESDRLPGIVFDRIGNALVLQTLCAGADTWIERLYTAAMDIFRPQAFFLKNTARSRFMEGLEIQQRQLSGPPGPVVYQENGIEYVTDLLEDQKTGAFLDQRDNHRLMGQLAFGKALDLFCYHGGFSLPMAKAGATVTAVDASAAAIARLQENAARNHLHVNTVLSDAFDFLGNLSETERYDTIVCDPPALCPRAEDRKNALAAYRRLAAGCFAHLKSDGWLLFCSCSAHISPDALRFVLTRGAHDVGRTFCVHKQVQAGCDHPYHPLIPESAYLKGFLVRAN